ncbi:MAG: hypothetical protein Cons2KO_10040 [Congregibacter sp.]
MPGRRAQGLFYVGMACLFLTTAVVGFGPNTIEVLSGEKLSPAPIVHLHAATMLAWLILLIAQAIFVRVGRLDWHARAGQTMLGLTPVIAVLMVILAIEGFPGLDSEHGHAILVLRMKRIVLFSGFAIWAYRVRISDSESHKRLVLLATFVVIDAAVNRMRFLPSIVFNSPIEFGLFAQFLLLAPLVAFDCIKLGNLHKATLIGTVMAGIFTGLGLALW